MKEAMLGPHLGERGGCLRFLIRRYGPRIHPAGDAVSREPITHLIGKGKESMKTLILFLCFVAALLLITGGDAHADEVWLKNGDRITGTLVRLEGDRLFVNTAYAGELSIAWQEVDNLQTDAPVTTLLGDNTSTQGRVSRGEDGRVIIQSADLEQPLNITLAQIQAINPKPPAPPLKTKVRVNAGATVTSGNTDTKSLYGDSEFVARTKTNRYTLGARVQKTEDNNVKTADNFFGYMKYDHFLTEKWYFYANATGEKDKFKDLELRSTVGIGAGYQFLETERTNLSLEAGISYVNDDFITAEDNSYSGGRWGFDFDHFLFDKALQFFHKNTGLVSFEDTDDTIIYTQTGIRIPFRKNLNVTAQVNYDYDKSPAPGREKKDKAYILSLGYQWGN